MKLSQGNAVFELRGWKIGLDKKAVAVPAAVLFNRTNLQNSNYR
jgi:hypothetical protein